MKQKLGKIDKFITENMESDIEKIENNMKNHIQIFELLKHKVNDMVKENIEETETQEKKAKDLSVPKKSALSGFLKK